MTSRVWALAGVLCGVVAGLAILAAVIVLAPESGATVASPSPGPSASPTAGATPPAATVASPGSSAAASGSASPGGSPAPSATRSLLHVGESAPVLAVPQVGGGFVDLGALRGHAVWLTFVAASCDACLDQLTLMSGFDARYEPNGLVVVAIDVRDSETAAAGMARKAGVTLPVGLDLDGHVQAEWDATTLPVHFFVDTEGVIRDAVAGVIGPDVAVRGLTSILPGVSVTP